MILRGREYMLTRQATMTDLSTLVGANIDPRLLSAGAEGVLFEELRSAISKHVVAVGMLKSAR